MCFGGGLCGRVLVGLNHLKGVVIKHLRMMYSCGGESNGCGSVGGVEMFRSFLSEYLYEQKLLCGWIDVLFIENVKGDINEGG